MIEPIRLTQLVQTEKKGWPNLPNWSAGKDNSTVEINGQIHDIWVQPCGELEIPSGQLIVCDPFFYLADLITNSNPPHIKVPKGRFPVSVTLIDMSESQSRSDVREAYASIVFQTGQESYRRALPLISDGEDVSDIPDGAYIGFHVEAGTACFIDAQSLKVGMPNESDCELLEILDDLLTYRIFDNDDPNCWFRLMDDPSHIRTGIANIILPKSEHDNVIIFRSGPGDGIYPIIGSFDAKDNLLAIHIDFGIVYYFLA